MGIIKPRILFLDAYDSFSHNIISLLEITLDVDVHSLKIDDPTIDSISKLTAVVKAYDAVICGPGPGHPQNENDIGAMKNIWKLSDEDLVPVLGICLGFQSLCLEFGADIKRLNGPQHGIIRRINHIGESAVTGQMSMFEEVGEVYATLYQSLCADIGQDDCPEALWNSAKWKATNKCPDLLPLAWVESKLTGVDKSGSGIADRRVFVGVRHRVKPFWALQYHPESICTNNESKRVINNWFREARSWNEGSARQVSIMPSSLKADRRSFLEQSLMEWEETTGKREVFEPDVNADVCLTLKLPIPSELEVPDIVEMLQDIWQDSIVLESSNASTPEKVHPDVRGRYSIIGLDIKDCVRLEYTVGDTTVKSRRYGLPDRQYPANPGNLEYNPEQPGGMWKLLAANMETYCDVKGDPESPFWGGLIGYTTYELGLEGIGVDLKSRTQPQDNKFPGQESQQTAQKSAKRPDACFVMVHKSVVVDHKTRMVYFQKIGSKHAEKGFMTELRLMAGKLFARMKVERGNICPVEFSNIPRITRKSEFLDHLKKSKFPYPDTCEYVYKDNVFTGLAYATYQKTPKSSVQIPKPCACYGSLDLTIHGQKIQVKKNRLRIDHQDERWNPVESQAVTGRLVSFPGNEEYEGKVRMCQEFIRSGDSYELCLTDQSTVEVCKGFHEPSAWSLYKKLRRQQPAPFASYLRLGSVTLVSASPERFLKWDENGQCELRPMKGTVRKTPDITLEHAKALLNVPKEQAENLMIVDLVRHDLHGICGSGNVSVPKLMIVEEYQSVYQMISIVQGKIPAPLAIKVDDPQYSEKCRANRKRFTGIDVLAASLPPGSMTGAPKKRSCEILQAIEQGKERSMYSGVVGYMDIGGRGDFSVTIRCMFKWDDEDREEVDEGGTKRKIETWHVGAGGAVTTLSTPEGEREEMFTKAKGTLGIF